MLLTELFNSRLEKSVVKDTNDEYQIKAKIGSHEIMFFGYGHGDGEFSVSFDAIDTPMDFMFTRDHASIQVLAFVKECIEELVKKHNPSKIYFTAKGKRAVIYRKMIARFALKDYEMADHAYGGEISFVLKKK